MPDTSARPASFRELNLPAPLLQALDDVGYETPTPIQSQAIAQALNQDYLASKRSSWLANAIFSA